MSEKRPKERNLCIHSFSFMPIRFLYILHSTITHTCMVSRCSHIYRVMYTRYVHICTCKSVNTIIICIVHSLFSFHLRHTVNSKTDFMFGVKIQPDTTLMFFFISSYAFELLHACCSINVPVSVSVSFTSFSNRLILFRA